MMFFREITEVRETREEREHREAMELRAAIDRIFGDIEVPDHIDENDRRFNPEYLTFKPHPFEKKKKAR